jgi:hypothetical protein
MEKKNNTWLVVLLVLIIMGLIGYICYDKFITKDVQKTEEKQVVSGSVEDFENLLDEMYNDGRAFYSYYKSGQKDFIKYLSSLDNSRKLELGSVMVDRSYAKVKNNLLRKYGTDLGVEAKDYYWWTTDEEPSLIYNADKDEYIWNEEIGGSDAITDLGEYTFYLYRLKNITTNDNTIVAAYYGLWRQTIDVGPDSYSNKNMDTVDLYDDNAPILSDYKLADYFKDNKAKFVEFRFTFEKEDNNIVLKNFEVL